MKGSYYKLVNEESDINVLGLQNMIKNMKNPAIMDIKLGYNSWGQHINEPG